MSVDRRFGKQHLRKQKADGFDLAREWEEGEEGYRLIQNLKQTKAPETVMEKYREALRTLPEPAPEKKHSPVFRYGLVAALCLSLGTAAFAAEKSGLFSFLYKTMSKEEVASGLRTKEAFSEENSGQTSSYGPLWTVTDSWYDGSVLYFYAKTSEKVKEDPYLAVSASDHALVNGQDCFLSADTSDPDLTLCTIDVSGLKDTETIEVEAELHLLRNKRKWENYQLNDLYPAEDYREDVTEEEVQSLRFTVRGGKAPKQAEPFVRELEDGEVEVHEAVFSQSLFSISFTYRMRGENAKERIGEVGSGLFTVTDESGNRTDPLDGTAMVGGTEISLPYTDENGDLCLDVVLSIGPVSLDPSSDSLTVTPCIGQSDAEGNIISYTEDKSWGSFTLAF